MSKPTPRPWQVTPDQVRIQTGEHVDDYQIANCDEGAHSPTMDICEANAYHIVKCVNMHDKLVAALKIFIAEFGAPQNISLAEFNSAKALLAKAKE